MILWLLLREPGTISQFDFNLLPLIYVIPSDVLPITHVLYIHNRIYGRVEVSSAIIFGSQDCEEKDYAASECNKVMIRYSDFDDLSGTDRITLSASGSRAGSGLHSFHDDRPIRIDNGTVVTKKGNLSNNESTSSNSSSEEEELPEK